MHVEFDLAKNWVIAHFLRKPDQLYFVTGLNFDIFGVVLSNLDCIDVHCLLEGHWPSRKTSDQVNSVVHHSIAKANVEIGQNVHTLNLLGDNCGGQNKNRQIL